MMEKVYSFGQDTGNITSVKAAPPFSVSKALQQALYWPNAITPPASCRPYQPSAGVVLPRRSHHAQPWERFSDWGSRQQGVCPCSSSIPSPDASWSVVLGLAGQDHAPVVLPCACSCSSAFATVTVSAQEAESDSDSESPGLIPFHSTRDGNYEIYLMNPDSSGLTRLTSDPANDSYLSWSPDGSRIAFNSNRQGNYDLFLVNVDGTGLMQLTDDSADDYYPTFSADGTQIAFYPIATDLTTSTS